MRSADQTLRLVAEIALAGLTESALPLEDRADFYEGLGAFLPYAEAEAAKYAATCIRETQRAQHEVLKALTTGKEVA